MIVAIELPKEICALIDYIYSTEYIPTIDFIPMLMSKMISLYCDDYCEELLFAWEMTNVIGSKGFGVDIDDENGEMDESIFLDLEYILVRIFRIMGYFINILENAIDRSIRGIMDNKMVSLSVAGYKLIMIYKE